MHLILSCLLAFLLFLLSRCGICSASKRAKNHRLSRDIGLLSLRLLDRQHEVCGPHYQLCRKHQQTRDQLAGMPIQERGGDTENSRVVCGWVG